LFANYTKPVAKETSEQSNEAILRGPELNSPEALLYVIMRRFLQKETVRENQLSIKELKSGNRISEISREDYNWPIPRVEVF